LAEDTIAEMWSTGMKYHSRCRLNMIDYQIKNPQVQIFFPNHARNTNGIRQQANQSGIESHQKFMIPPHIEMIGNSARWLIQL